MKDNFIESSTFHYPRLLFVVILGFLAGNYFFFILKTSKIIVMPIIVIIGIISGMFLVGTAKNNIKYKLFYLIYIMFFLGIFYNILYDNNYYQEAIKLSGTSKNVILQIKSRTISSNNSFTYEAKIIGLENFETTNSILIRAFSSKKFEIGDAVFANVKFRLPTNNLDFDYRNYLASKGYFLLGNIQDSKTHYVIAELKNVTLLDRLRQYVRESLFNSLDEESASIALAMSIGDRSYLSINNKTSLASSGLMHIISVSGSHFSILTEYLSLILKNFSIKRKPIAIISIIFSVFYLTLIGYDPAVLRSAIMSVLFFISVITDRSYDRLNALGISAFISCIINPYMTISAGFILSYLSIIGIFYLAPSIKGFLDKIYEKHGRKSRKNKLTRYIINGISISLGVNLILLPVNTYYFNQISLVAPLSNLLAEPIIPIILLFSILSLIVFSTKISFLINLFSGILSLFTKIFISISDVFASFSFSEISISLDMFLVIMSLAVIIYVVYRAIKEKSKLFKRAILFLSVVIIISLSYIFTVSQKNKIYFHSVSSSISSSFILYDNEELVVVLENSSNYDGGRINEIIGKTKHKTITALVICDEKENTINSAADILKKYNAANIISKSALISSNSDVRLIDFTSSIIKVYEDIYIKILKKSVVISFRNFSVGIYNDGEINKHTNVAFLNNTTLSKEVFGKISTDVFIRKPIYSTEIYEIIPNIYDELNMVWQSDKKIWREIY